MTPEQVLEKIIRDNGACDIQAELNMCPVCPLNHARRDSFGEYISCCSYVEIKTNGTTDQHFLKEARRMLAEIQIDRYLLGKTDETD